MEWNACCVGACSIAVVVSTGRSWQFAWRLVQAGLGWAGLGWAGLVTGDMEPGPWHNYCRDLDWAQAASAYNAHHHHHNNARNKQTCFYCYGVFIVITNISCVKSHLLILYLLKFKDIKTSKWSGIMTWWNRVVCRKKIVFVSSEHVLSLSLFVENAAHDAV